MSQKVVLQIHQGDTSHKLRGPFLEHSFNIFWYVPHKIRGGKYAGLVHQKKRSGLFVEGIPQHMFWGMVKWLLQKTIARDIFFCPKSVWRNGAFDISNIFRRIFSCVSQKHILKTFAKCFGRYATENMWTRRLIPNLFVHSSFFLLQSSQYSGNVQENVSY